MVNAPSGFALDAPTTNSGDADVVLLFVRDRADVEGLAGAAVDLALREGLSWIAYPKAGQLGTDLNRDVLWELLGSRGVRPVRNVAIDDTWSALRFRPIS